MNCTECGGLLEFKPEQVIPFQIRVSCTDCGRYSIYDCVKPNEPEKDNVVLFDGITLLDLPADLILKKAIDHGMSEVVIIGYDNNGDEYFASSDAEVATALGYLAGAQHKLFNHIDEIEGE